MRFVVVMTVLCAAAGVYLVDENRLMGAGIGAVTGMILGIALKSLPLHDPPPDDIDKVLDDD